MNTTAAALEAHVTAATIRTWCRRGAVAAVKQAGRWIIDTASLARRIAIGARRAKKPAKVTLTVENVKAIGGSEWIRGDYHRVYLNDWAELAGIDVDYYKTGNVCGATIDGRGIANSRIGRILGTVRKVYFDATDGRLYVQHDGAEAVEIRYLDGERTHINLVGRISAGVRAAVAAL